MDTKFIDSKKIIDFSKFNNTILAKKSNSSLSVKNCKSSQNCSNTSYDINFNYLHKNVVII